MNLRCTTRMLTLLGVRATTLADGPPSQDDWCLNLLWIECRKCLLLTHAETLFPVFAADSRKAEITPIGPNVATLVEEHLRSEKLPADTLGRLDPDHVILAKTVSGSILGVVNDSATPRALPNRSDGRNRSLQHPLFLNRYLRRALHHWSRNYVTPLDLLVSRLRFGRATVAPPGRA
ncbi:MAG TPA: hypothetical protein VEH79_01615 [Gaiellaceae bacterium]|nr:hypothetical protein [Gaiellaceae bacterium]